MAAEDFIGPLYRYNTEPNYGVLVGVCRAMVDRQQALFGRIPSISPDDLLQEALITAHRVHRTYRPDKGAYTPFIARGVRCRFLDLWKVNTRAQIREVATARPGVSYDPPLLETSPGNLIPLLAQAYLVARRTLPAHNPHPCPRRYTYPQLAAALCLKTLTRTSYRGVVLILQASPSLRDTLNLRDVPRYRRLGRCHDLIGGAKTVNAILAQAQREIEDSAVLN